MIYSIGHDIVENQRISALIDRYGMRVIHKILTAAEMNLYSLREDKVKFVAKRFAAKEAFAKACGTGIRAPVLLSNISILNDALGCPYIVVSAELEAWLTLRGISKWHLSLSDEKLLSSAVVIFEAASR